ncbi:unnamed protein product [Closterium sp. Naga37s-1]|nr:unnamed protein product [Closterium sp. Naga37s-1]
MLLPRRDQDQPTAPPHSKSPLATPLPHVGIPEGGGGGGGGGGGVGGAPPPTSTIYVANLPPGADEELLAEHFGTIGLIKRDKRTGRAKVWLYRDKESTALKGDATVTYEDPFAAVLLHPRSPPPPPLNLHLPFPRFLHSPLPPHPPHPPSFPPPSSLLPPPAPLPQRDKRTGRAKVWLYRDKESMALKGDATVTYEDPFAAAAAVDWFHNKDFHGRTIAVSLAQTKHGSAGGAGGGGNGFGHSGDVSGRGEEGGGGGEVRGGGGGDGGAVAAAAQGKPWQQQGDWMYTAGWDCSGMGRMDGGGRECMGKVWWGGWVVRSIVLVLLCGNVNFAFRGECNRCATPRPAGGGGGAGGGGAGMGRGGGRGGRGGDSGRGGRGFGGPPGLFGPMDWPCPMCGNMNWAKRAKCNICNTSRPGTSEGGAREGRGGGYKELDEAELEETRKRRKEAEEDDGEMYDEFGNLKKKFRKKLAADAAAAAAGGAGGKGGGDGGASGGEGAGGKEEGKMGKALWEEDLKTIHRQGSRKNQDSERRSNARPWELQEEEEQERRGEGRDRVN